MSSPVRGYWLKQLKVVTNLSQLVVSQVTANYIESSQDFGIPTCVNKRLVRQRVRMCKEYGVLRQQTLA